jgi:hypothetical protein
MRFQPAMGHRMMHRGAVFVDVATCAQEFRVDRTDRSPASMIGLKPVCNFEQLRHRGFRIRQRADLFEFHQACLVFGCGENADNGVEALAIEDFAACHERAGSPGGERGLKGFDDIGLSS